ncbi:CAP Gly-rich domain [Dillenia turbinata]|uniref:CAP Gly-rich domain n=1 Tax=Dillenia turbinata TaxID=194707 RepID=A0AAN8Z1D5_9MAGN
MQNSEKSDTSLSGELKTGERVHMIGDCQRIGTVKYVGAVEGLSGLWVGVDWDNGNAKHDGSLNGIRYFQATSPKSASFVRPRNLSHGISVLDALKLRYCNHSSTKQEEDEMYVFSASSKRVSVQLVGKEKIEDKLSRFEELTTASLSYLGVNSAGCSSEISAIVSNLKVLDLTGNLLSEWKDVGAICEQLPALHTLNLTNNRMAHEVEGLPLLENIRVLVLNDIGVDWLQVEMLKQWMPTIEELYLIGNNIRAIMPTSSAFVEGFNCLRLLNLEDNSLDQWDEILKLSQLRSLEQLYLTENNLKQIFYPDNQKLQEVFNGYKSLESSHKPFHNLHCLLLGGNNIEDPASVDSLNLFPSLVDIRLTENPIADPGKGGIPRYSIIARLAKVKILNGSEVSPQERKDSEIRYVHSILSKFYDSPEEVKRLHPRFGELKSLHGIEDERPSIGATGPQKMASGLVSITLKCVGASIGEKPPVTKKLPATTTVGKLKMLCESFFKLKPMKLKLFLQEGGSPLPTLLDDEMTSLMDIGIGQDSTFLIDDES